MQTISILKTAFLAAAPTKIMFSIQLQRIAIWQPFRTTESATCLTSWVWLSRPVCTYHDLKTKLIINLIWAQINK